jgi:hypothetical protein
MAQQLRSRALPTEDPTSVPSIQLSGLQLPIPRFQGIRLPRLGSLDTYTSMHRPTHRWTNVIYIIKTK